MSAIPSASADPSPAPPQDWQALSLWTFIHLNVPRFTTQAALEVVKALGLRPDEDVKQLANRLSAALAERGVNLKHTNALIAASRLVGHDSWHAARRAAPVPKLRLLPLSDSGEETLSSWRLLAPRLCAYCEAAIRETGAKVVHVRFTPNAMTVDVPRKTTESSRTEFVPILIVTPIGDAGAWMQESPAALEHLRRFLEESARAALDGIAVLHLCNRPDDACNSELVLMRQDNELDPAGWEIARGDELICWSQLELAIKDEQEVNIVLEHGAWRIGAGRYVWQLSTIHPRDFIPGLVVSELGARDSEKLFRRYKLVKGIFSGRIKHHEITKRLQYLSEPADRLRVDLHQLLLAMNAAGLTWETYCAESGQEEPMVPQLPMGFVLSLLERLNLSNPNVVFARPPRSEMQRVDDDGLLRALMPRVDHVTYRLPSGLPEQVRQRVESAIKEFSTSMHLQKSTESGAITFAKEPLPYLVYAGDGEELRLTLEGQGLVMYVAVIPHLFKTDGIIEQRPGMWRFAFGHSLYIAIDHADVT